ncbi:type II toxin-antitoxin system death-on-curing family toxin [Allokutzneria multivorans]|uniref:Type II toxin-antitoxin system death-on-curing family toxin n=1 Tax=Allokutzneria multivorans TaxID=1142134 RepID=A0ABP7RI29_9PSEU
MVEDPQVEPVDYLDLDDLLAAAHAALGHAPDVRDWGLLEAALARPKAVVFGEDAYPTLHEKAASLLHSLARNHALIDGNKRLAWVCTRLFYVLNQRDLRAPSVDDGERLVVDAATGARDLPQIAQVLDEWTQSLG